MNAPRASAAPDLVIIGAGAFGLWTALACLGRGLRVTVAEAGPLDGPQPASSGPVGALAPFAPDPWTPLKALQLDALRALPARLRALEAETGLPTGFAPTGRVAPLASPEARTAAEARAQAAARHWGPGRMWVADPAPDRPPHWPRAPFGALCDDLSATLDPPLLLAALRAAVAARGGVLRPGLRFRRWDGARAICDAATLPAAACVLTAGAATFALGPLPGGPVHGAALRLRATPPPGAPLIQAPGLWIAPHGGTVGIGSTTRPGDTDPGAEAALHALLTRARALVPALARAPVLHRWHGLRPRAAQRLPVAGALSPDLYVATGGMGIGLPLAPLIADHLAGLLSGDPRPAPAGLASPAPAP